jgi:glycosyltransferase involved in cell wall biosynthesis
MRILLACDFFPPSPGGLESHVKRLAEALLQRGHEVAIVTGTAQPEVLSDRSTIVSAVTVLGRAPLLFQDGARPFPPPFADPSFRHAVRSFADQWKPDLIHAHGWCAFSCYWSGAPPLVVTLHDHGLRCPKRTLLRGGAECSTGRSARCVTCTGDLSVVKRLPLAAVMGHSVRALVAHTSRFIAVSRSVERRLVERGISASLVEVIPNFLDIDDTVAGVAVSPPVILFVGPDGFYKGRPVLIEAFHLLPLGRARLVLVGSKSRVNANGVSNFEYLRDDALWEQYRTASVVTVPSIWPDPCPTVVLEAMAHGRPVVGSRIGGIPDLVEDGLSGLLVTPNDSSALANSLMRILTDHKLRQRLGSAARVRALEFGTAAVVPRIEKIYALVRSTDIRGVR